MFEHWRSAKGKKKASGDFAWLLVTVWDPSSAASEAYRTLRTSLLYGQVADPPKTIVLTSSGDGEGKSTTCANLGVVLAQVDKRTLIVDCDFRRPAIHKLFELKTIFGLVNVLAGERSPEEVWHEPRPNLTVVTTGPLPPDPTKLLASRSFAEFLHHVRQKFDYVLLDTSPALLVSDPAIVAAQSDGVLLVVDAQNTRKGAVRRSIKILRAVGATVLGTVMNNVKPLPAHYYYDGEPYGSGK